MMPTAMSTGTRFYYRTGDYCQIEPNEGRVEMDSRQHQPRVREIVVESPIHF